MAAIGRGGAGDFEYAEGLDPTFQPRPQQGGTVSQVMPVSTRRSGRAVKSRATGAELIGRNAPPGITRASRRRRRAGAFGQGRERKPTAHIGRSWRASGRSPRRPRAAQHRVERLVADCALEVIDDTRVGVDHHHSPPRGASSTGGRTCQPRGRTRRIACILPLHAREHLLNGRLRRRMIEPTIFGCSRKPWKNTPAGPSACVTRPHQFRAAALRRPTRCHSWETVPLLLRARSARPWPKRRLANMVPWQREAPGELKGSLRPSRPGGTPAPLGGLDRGVRSGADRRPWRRALHRRPPAVRPRSSASVRRTRKPWRGLIPASR